MTGGLRISDSRGGEVLASLPVVISEPPTWDRIVTGSHPDGFTVPEGEKWLIQGMVEAAQNVIVHGTLGMRGHASSVLRFVGVNESAFVGTQGSNHNPVASDVGLWVTETGQLDLVGDYVDPWNRIGDHPSWDSSDSLVRTPAGFIERSGRLQPITECSPYSLGDPLPQFTPRVPPVEVFNLRRTVRIEGTPGGRTHMHIHSMKPQHIENVAFRYMGPRDGAIAGRYPVHFHHCGDGSRGSIVKGCLVWDSGDHAYVPHASNGVTFQDCVGYRVKDSIYWWDPIKGTGSYENMTDDISYIGCLAAEQYKGNHFGSFYLVAGKGGVVRGCVAAGVAGGTDTSGFAWPPNDEQSWIFEDNLAHNVLNGIWVWQNANSFEHIIDGYTAYSCRVGIDDGAYGNRYQYHNVLLDHNAEAGATFHAMKFGEAGRPWDGWRVHDTDIGLLRLHTPGTGGSGITLRGFQHSGLGQLIGEGGNPPRPPITFIEAEDEEGVHSLTFD